LVADHVVVEPEVVLVVDHEVVEPEVALVVDHEVVEPEVALVADYEVVEPGVVFVVEPEVVFVVDHEVSEPEVVFVVDHEVVEPEVALVAGHEVVEREVVLVAVASVADSAEPQAFVDIAVPFAFLIPVSVVVVEVDSPGRPRLFAFPSIDYYASPSSSVEVVGKESVHNSTVSRTNYGLCSILSSLDLHQNRTLEHCYNNPSPGYNNVNDTNDLPMDATTSHSRKTGLPLSQEQRKHWEHQGSLSDPVVQQTRWAAANQY